MAREDEDPFGSDWMEQWGHCPYCVKRAEEQHAKNKEEFARAYGIVPPEEYLNLAHKAQQVVHIGANLSETADFKIENFVLIMVYKAKCKICGFTMEVRHTESIPPDPKGNQSGPE